MQTLIDAIERALADENWLAALALSLVLPDICGKIESPALASQKRYVHWFSRYIEPVYTKNIGKAPHVFLSGDDCYALRCAYLHEGSEDTGGQRAAKALTAFRFVPPSLGTHGVQIDGLLCLDVAEFCRDMCKGVSSWYAKEVAPNPTLLQKAEQTLRIYDTGFSVN